mmetsp:Transcript_11226/g.19200  ORF Transcript_11226/g.19200 Transcript_11226/m.19200 type:complete len:200 (+) Transcript_11226:128-727(+)
MASVRSAIRTCDRARSCASAMSATTAHTRGGASFAAGQASPTPTTAKSARSRRKTATAVPRLSTWARARLTCSTSERSTGSRRGSAGRRARRRSTWRPCAEADEGTGGARASSAAVEVEGGGAKRFVGGGWASSGSVGRVVSWLSCRRACVRVRPSVGRSGAPCDVVSHVTPRGLRARQVLTVGVRTITWVPLRRSARG